MIKKIPILILFLFYTLIGSGQATADFTGINPSAGLSNNTVIAIIQDNMGFMWFGTDDGLNRYDGFEFRVFKPQPKNKNSITHNIAKAIFQDSGGKIWIGTDGGGLSKFDPVSEDFTNFTANEGDSTGLSHNNISAITEDAQGTIYVATYGGGINVLKKGAEKFTHIKSDNSQQGGLSTNYINTLLADSNGNLWIGTWAKGVDVLNLGTGKFRNFENRANDVNSLGSNTVNCFYQDRNGGLWAGTWQGGLCYYSPARSNFVQIEISDPVSKTVIKPIVRSISEDHLGNLWLGTFGHGLIKYNPRSSAAEFYKNEPGNMFSLVNNNIWSTCFSRDNILWIGTIDGGLNKLDLNRRKFEKIDRITGNGDPLKSTIVTSLFENAEREIIIGTREDGFSVFSSDLKKFRSYKKTGSNSLVSNNVNSIVEDRFSDLWIGTRDGLSRYSPSSGKYENYAQMVYNFNSLSINNTTQVFEDRSGNIWIATWGGGVNRFNRESNSFEHFQASEKTRVTFRVDMSGQKISHKGVHLSGFMNGWNPSVTKMYRLNDHQYTLSLELYPSRIEFKYVNGDQWGGEELVPVQCAENNNRVLIVGNRDIDLSNVLFGKDCHVINYGPEKLSDKKQGNFIASNHVYCIAEDKSGFLWFGTNNGLSRFDRKKNEFKNYNHSENDLSSISDNHVSYICVASNGNLWIGTLGGGLNYFDVRNEKFSCYTESEGLANNMVKSILEDKNGNIWVATNSGISRLNPSSREFLNFDTYNGLKTSSFYIGACLKRNNGQLLFGSTDGMVVFHPDSFELNSTPPKVCFSDFRIFNKSVPVGKLADGRTILEKSIQYADKINLSYKDNIISFHFSNLQFAAPEKNSFAYKLEGFDKEWRYTDSRNRSATYTNLSGGNYTFLVKTLAADGRWTEIPTQLKVYVKPPFYKSVWFITLVSMMLLTAVLIWYRFRIKARESRLLNEKMAVEAKLTRLEKEKLENEVEHKNKELASLTLHMTNKARILNEQISHLEMIARQSDKSTQDKLGRLINKLQDDVNLDKDWEFFERHFDKVHLNFISQLKSRYPELSANEIRLAAYIRMGMSTKDIAEITNKTIRGIESSRYRLRQNLHLDTSDNLNDFLFKL